MNDYYPLNIGDDVLLVSYNITGTVTNKDNSDCPFEVTFNNGSRNWFKRSELRKLGH